jgi:translin
LLLNLKKVMDDIEKELDEKDQIRELALKISREIVRNSSALIASINRGEKEKKIVQSVRELKSKVLELHTLVDEHQDIYNSGFVEDALQEYVEALLLRSAVLGKQLPGHAQLRVSASVYVMGLSDLIGEFRRIALKLIMDGKLKEAEKWVREMEELYEAIMKLHYPSSLVNVRKKQDTARSLLDRTLGELTTALAVSKGIRRASK